MTPEEILRKLLKDHFEVMESSFDCERGLEWKWTAGYTVGGADPELESALIEYLPDDMKIKYQKAMGVPETDFGDISALHNFTHGLPSSLSQIDSPRAASPGG